MKRCSFVVIALATAALSCGGKADTPSPAAPAPAATMPAATMPAATATAGPVKVTLSWDKPVDMDLEIWNTSGNLIHRAFPGKKWSAANCGTDVKDGTEGQEFFIFKKVGDEDFTTGEYVVSVYFAARTQDSSVSEAFVTVTVQKADGSVETRRRKILWEKGQDQWHVLRLDAATGRIVEDIDKLVKVTQD